MFSSIRKSGGSILVVLALLVIWQLLHMKVGDGALSSPWVTVVKLAQMIASGELAPHVMETGKALIYALLLAVIGGVALGLILGVHRLSGNVAEPILLNLYSIPKVSLYPLVLMVFGLGLSAKVAFGVMHGLIPIMIFTMNALRQMKPVYMRAARTLHIPLRQTVAHVLLPAILPELISGLRLSFSLTLFGVLIGEMFASQKGLGYLMTNAMGLGDSPTIMAVALLLIIFAVTCNALFMFFDHRFKHK